MKNLKKVLSLALAFAMVLGLCIGASAAQDVTTLTDWAEVENKDAATLLNAFNIMQGDDKGFRPHDNVKRTEAAKMISVAMWGGSDDVNLYSGNNYGGYTDVVAGSWYMGYVNYLSAIGVMTGKGEGVFDPDGTVTGNELLKMCLVALGYNPETEGLTGAGWDVKTMSLATKTGFKNLTADTDVANWNAPLDRMNAATIIANMIGRNTVTYSTIAGGASNGATIVVDSEKTYGEAVLGMTVVTGTLVANEFGSTVTIGDTDSATAAKAIDKTARNYKEQNAIVALTKDTSATDKTQIWDKNVQVKLNSSYEDLGMAVKLYYIKGVANPISAAAVGGVKTDIAWKADFSATTNVEDGVAGAGAVFADNTDVQAYDTDGDGYIEYIRVTTFDGDDMVVTSTASSEKYGTVYMTNDIEWNQSRYEAAQANSVKRNAYVASNTNFTAEKGDHVIYATVKNAFGTDLQRGYVLEAVEGKVTSTQAATATAPQGVWIDGVKHSNGTGADLALGNEGTFYLFANGNIAQFKAKAGGSVEGKPYAVIYDAGYDVAGSTTGIGSKQTVVTEVAAVLADGTNKAFTVKNIVVMGADKKTYNTYDITKATEADLKTTNTLKGKTQTGAEAAANGLIAPFAAGGLLENVNNQNMSTGAANGNAVNKLVAYDLNADGTLTLYVDASNVLAGTDTLAATVGNPAAAQVVKASEKASATATGAGTVYFTKDTVSYVQTKEDGKDEAWVIYKGLTVPGFSLKATAPYIKGNYSGTDGKAVGTLMLTKTGYEPTGAQSTGIFYIVTTPVQKLNSDNEMINEASVYNSETNKVETITWTESNTAVKAGQIFESFDEDNGFDDEIAPDTILTAGEQTNYGFITNFEGNVLRIATYDADGAEKEVGIYTVDSKETRYFYIDGDKTGELKAADIAKQANDTLYGYETLVKADNGVASVVITFAKTQKADPTKDSTHTKGATVIGSASDLLKTDAFKGLAVSNLSSTIEATAADTFTVKLSGVATVLTADNNTGFGITGKAVICLNFGECAKGTSVTGGTTDTGTDDAKGNYLYAIDLDAAANSRTVTLTANGVTITVDWENVTK